MGKRLRLLLAVLWIGCSSCTAEWPGESHVSLQTPQVSRGEPAAGKRVAVTSAEYQGTDVFHTVYLPPDWKADGSPCPIIFEYTGNYFPAAGSTGRVEDAGLGYGLTGGRCIWVSLPYVSHDGKSNQSTWWGDVRATVRYAKRNVPKIIERFNAASDAVFLCGFSRGAIGVSYIGLHDDEISKLWTAFITHDHFDGVREWKGTEWGSPLADYRAAATVRLRRVGNRPFLVCENNAGYGTRKFVESVFSEHTNFTFLEVDTCKAMGVFPNDLAKASHNDRWLCVPSQYRKIAWRWMAAVATTERHAASGENKIGK